MRNWKLIICLLLFFVPCHGQSKLIEQNPSAAPLGSELGWSAAGDNRRVELPAAPSPQMAKADPMPRASLLAGENPPSGGTSSAGGAAQRLTLHQAEEIALKNNPRISVARLLSLASQQVVRETRSPLWPSAAVDLTAVTSHDTSRITAGALNNPIIYERAAGGVVVSQLITDFGRTSNVVASSRLASKAEDQNTIATREQVLLAVHQAFYNTLQAAAVLKVAQQTVEARQAVADQIGALYKSKLKSEIDFSFANVNLAQARLLLLDAQNNHESALATLAQVLGYADVQHFELVEDGTAPTSPPANVEDLIREALAQRPELLSLDYQYQAAQKFHTAERDLLLPSVRAMGAVGGTPLRAPELTSWYGAVGVNVEIPVFNGFLYSARAKTAALQADAARDRLRDLRNTVSRDVRTSWLTANADYERLSVTQQMLQQANLALELAQARYKLGLSSIVELSQAELQQTQAAISNTEAGYDYRLALNVLDYQRGRL
jgi:outer membrane protein